LRHGYIIYNKIQVQYAISSYENKREREREFASFLPDGGIPEKV